MKKAVLSFSSCCNAEKKNPAEESSITSQFCKLAQAEVDASLTSNCSTVWLCLTARKQMLPSHTNIYAIYQKSPLQLWCESMNFSQEE